MIYQQLVAQAATDERAAEVLAVMASQTGRPKAARAAVESFLASHPTASRLWTILALIDIADGQPDKALAHLKQAGEADSGGVDVIEARGRAHLELGDLAEATAAFKAVLARQSGQAQAHNGLGRIACATADWSTAETHFLAAQEARPSWPAPTINLAVADMRRGRVSQAVSRLRAVLDQHPRLEAAWTVLIDALLSEARINEALEARAEVERLNIEAYLLRNACGRVCLAAGMHAEAVVEFERATTLREQSSEAYNNLSCALRQQGDHSAAVAAIERAIAMNPGQGESWNSRGMLFMDDGNISEAQRCFDMAVQLAPQHEPSRLNHAQIPWMLGMLDETIQRLEEAVLLLPKSRRLLSRLLMAMHYAPRFAPRRIEAVARSYGQLTDAAIGLESGTVRSTRRDDDGPDDSRPLRLGIVSADFRMHPVGWALRRLIPAWRRRRVDVFGYFNHPTRDGLTDQMSQDCSGFTSIAGRSDADVAAMIVRDEIDVLIDMSGHTAGHRLGVFAQRPAPRQYTWMGFFGTTGMACFDGLISDSVVLPQSTSSVHTEPILQLDRCFFAVDPRDLPPLPTTPPPSIMTGHLTLGSFNNPLKYCADAIRHWVQVLDAVPDAHLLLCYPSMDPATTEAHVRKRFIDAGMDARRLEIRCDLSREQALAEYGRVDLALDPMQVNGGMTTVEALWMGVPVLGIRGDRQSNRIGESFMVALGEPEWVVESNRQLIELVQKLGQDIEARVELRRELRGRVERSALCDVEGLADAVLEQVLAHSGPSPA